MGDDSYKVQVTLHDGTSQVFVSQSAQGKSGSAYDVINDFFGGKAFVSFFDYNQEKDWPAAVCLTLTETVQIPGPARQQSAPRQQGSANSFKGTASNSKPKVAPQSTPKKQQAAASSLDDIPF